MLSVFPRDVLDEILNLFESVSERCMYLCMYSNSRNDVPCVAQRYGTIAAHKRRRASVLVVFVVFCVRVYSFAGLIRRTPPPTFSDTAITDRHSDTTIFQLRAHWVRISWSIGSEKGFLRVFLPTLLYVSFREGIQVSHYSAVQRYDNFILS